LVTRRTAPRLLIGVLAVQGAFAEHEEALAAIGGRSRRVRSVADMAGVDGLIIPGGESTTLGRVAGESGLLAEIAARVADGLPVFGTCAGMIMLASDTTGGPQPLIGGMDIVVRRNGYGRQCASFEAPIDVPVIGSPPMMGVFIRAPWVESAGPSVEVLAEHAGRVVAARQGNMLVTAFHPELTDDRRLHRWFLDGIGRDDRRADVTTGGFGVRAQ
jgi:pyridoxal 5'-phosphate synthase pdxT subunit